jgi:hypothetical protein
VGFCNDLYSRLLRRFRARTDSFQNGQSSLAITVFIAGETLPLHSLSPLWVRTPEFNQL